MGLEQMPLRDRDAETELRECQRLTTRGEQALTRRNELLIAMYDAGYRQSALAEILSAGAAAAGGAELSEGAVHKAIRRNRSALAVRR